MNLRREPKENLTEHIIISITPDDYREKVDKILKDLQRKANVPGFRPGKVPFGLVKKMYNKNVVADETLKLVESSLDQYIKDENIEMVGFPMPQQDDLTPIDWDHQENFEFVFEIGTYAPIDIQLSESIEVEYPEISVEDKNIDDYIENLRQRHGEFHSPEISSEDDMLGGEVIAVDEAGKSKEGAVAKRAYTNPEQLNTEGKAIFSGKKKDDVFVFEPTKCFDTKEHLAQFFGIKPEEADSIEGQYQMTVNYISHVLKADLGPELYKKAYPMHEITEYDDFRKQVALDFAASYQNDTDQQFLYHVQKKLLSMVDIALPEDFLRRYILANNDNKITPEQLDTQWSSYMSSFRWQLIEKKLVKDAGLEVAPDEVRRYVKEKYVLPYFQDQESSPELDQRLDTIVTNILKKEEDMKRIFNSLYDEKLKALFREKLKVVSHSYTYQEFIDLTMKNVL